MDAWGCAFLEGMSEQVHFGVEAISIAMTALTKSMNWWILFNVTSCSDDV